MDIQNNIASGSDSCVVVFLFGNVRILMHQNVAGVSCVHFLVVLVNDLALQVFVALL
jgi:hypothetical protein